MIYALLIYAAEDVIPAMTEAEHEAFFAGYREFNAAVEAAGVFVGANRLHSVREATTARTLGGKVAHTDGPFAETKETLAGFYLLDCADLAEAQAWAERVPGVRIGAVEVRPVMPDPSARS